LPLDHSQIENVARELAALAIDIEAIGVELCVDAAVAAAHSTSLQSIDLIGQRQRALADLLRAENFDHALADCNLSRIVDLFADDRTALER
jgi:hypothetical protein